MKLENTFKERKSLGQDVFEYLKNAIIDQTIEPGSRLVESKISDMLGISTSSVWRRMRAEEMPGCVKLGQRSLWSHGEVSAFVASRFDAARDADKQGVQS